jgi:hypothetical protein
MAALGWMILWMRHVLPVGPVVRGDVFTTTICTIHNSRKFHTKSDCGDFDARLGDFCDRRRCRGCSWDDVRQGRALPAHVCAVCGCEPRPKSSQSDTGEKGEHCDACVCGACVFTHSLSRLYGCTGMSSPVVEASVQHYLVMEAMQHFIRTAKSPVRHLQ